MKAKAPAPAKHQMSNTPNACDSKWKGMRQDNHGKVAGHKSSGKKY